MNLRLWNNGKYLLRNRIVVKPQSVWIAFHNQNASSERFVGAAMVAEDDFVVCQPDDFNFAGFVGYDISRACGESAAGANRLAEDAVALSLIHI